MKFYKTFGIKKGDVVCVAGSGGKTSLILHLAEELTSDGYSVLITATTKFASHEISDKFNFLVNINGEKAEAPNICDIEKSVPRYDIVLIEADGSACKPLKGWKSTEPVIPRFATLTIGVTDISTVGKSPMIHRPEIFEKLTAYSGTVSVQNIADILNRPEGIFRNSAHTGKIVFLTKCETEKDIENSFKLAKLTNHTVTYGSVHNKNIYKHHKLGAVIMAAGASARMGENKLIMPVHGQPLIKNLLNSFPAELFDRSILVYSSEDVAENADYDFIQLLKIDGGLKKNITIKAGTEKCTDCKGVMFFAADQPFLQTGTIQKTVYTFLQDTSKIVIPVCGGKKRNPVIFPESVFPELINLTGDRGGRDVIDRHPELCTFVSFENEKQFADIDTRQDYEKYTR